MLEEIKQVLGIEGERDYAVAEILAKIEKEKTISSALKIILASGLSQNELLFIAYYLGVVARDTVESMDDEVNAFDVNDPRIMSQMREIRDLSMKQIEERLKELEEEERRKRNN